MPASKKSPLQDASGLSVGHRQRGIDGRMYKVVATKKDGRRWQACETETTVVRSIDMRGTAGNGVMVDLSTASGISGPGHARIWTRRRAAVVDDDGPPYEVWKDAVRYNRCFLGLDAADAAFATAYPTDASRVATTHGRDGKWSLRRWWQGSQERRVPGWSCNCVLFELGGCKYMFVSAEQPMAYVFFTSGKVLRLTSPVKKTACEPYALDINNNVYLLRPETADAETIPSWNYVAHPIANSRRREDPYAVLRQSRGDVDVRRVKIIASKYDQKQIRSG